MLHLPLVPLVGMFTERMDSQSTYPWWMSFNQVKGLPEKLLEGRFRYGMLDESKMTDFGREVYAAVYDNPDSMCASNPWYQTFGQDIEDSKTDRPLSLPVLGIASQAGYDMMNTYLPYVANDFTLTGAMDSGHYLFEEKPEPVIAAISNFLS